MKKMNAHGRRAQGYTLMELLIVITIIGVLLGVAVTNFAGVPDDAKIKATAQEIRNMEQALELYRMKKGSYPTTEQGLEVLTDPSVTGKKSGFLKKLPSDGWENAYIYLSPGNHGEFDIYSLGPDKRESEDDIANWKLD